jgi:hypothetical protein
MSDPKLSQYQLDKLKERYAEMIVDGMDIDTLCEFAYEQILMNVHEYNQDDMFDQVEMLYDKETLEDMIPEPSISDLESTAPDYGVGK